MLSEDERDIDVDSDDDQNSYRGGDPSNKRAHHNALERKRRDHIKDSFCKLRDAIPAMQGDKLSRAQILKKASEYILSMRKKNSTHQKDVDDLKRQNSHLEAQIRALERAKTQGNFSSVSDILNQSGLSGNPVAVQQQENSSDDLASYDIGSDSQDSSDVYSVSGHSLLQSASSAIEPPTKKGKPDQKNSNNQDSGFKKRIV